MIGRTATRWVVPAAALALLVALTGCGELGAQHGTGSLGSTGASSPSASAPAAGVAVGDSAALDGISKDLDSADTANTEAGSNAAEGDQAGATGDEP